MEEMLLQAMKECADIVRSGEMPKGNELSLAELLGE